jgi:hypothetical protein
VRDCEGPSVNFASNLNRISLVEFQHNGIFSLLCGEVVDIEQIQIKTVPGILLKSLNQFSGMPKSSNDGLKPTL